MADRVIVYVDGFNLYYAVRSTPYRWLDLRALSLSLIRPSDSLVHIKYFTARVKGTPRDPMAPMRQQVFLRALRTLPDLSIYFGHFLVSEPRMPLKYPPPTTIQVIKTEEKGSDVALATHLLTDAFLDSYDTALVISNDSDLCPPIQMVRNQFGKPVGVINPFPRSPSKPLLYEATFVKALRQGALAASQFAPTLTDQSGVISKPLTW